MSIYLATCLNPLTAAIRGSGYKLFVKCRRYPGGPARMPPAKWCRYPGAQLERYIQSGTVIRMTGFIHKIV